MSVGLSEPEHFLAVDGIRLAVASAGLYKQTRNDVVLLEIADGATAAAVFTRNRFAAAPVTVAKTHLIHKTPRYCLINAGYANAGTGQSGMEDTLTCCRLIAEHAGCSIEQVLPFSTGVIGERLPVEKISTVIPGCIDNLEPDAWLESARAIMTTDTVAKGISRQVVINGRTVTITGIAKGSGMIRPDMATMLAFISTDAGIEPALLQDMLAQSVESSFNRISVDGDTSTNDACLLLATGKSGVVVSKRDTDAVTEFGQALNTVCTHLALSIVRDGEGATKLVTVEVDQGNDREECLQVAWCIAHSPLVKTALFASDPNWGRILAAVGRSGIEDLEIDSVEIFLGDVCIVTHGGRAETYTEEQGQAVMQHDEILIRVVLHRGETNEQVWTTDLSYDYVRINAEYRT